MNNNQIVEILQSIVEPFIEDKKQILPSDNLADDLGFDSVDIVDLIVHIEDQFRIEFTETELDSFKTVSDIVNIIKRKTNE